MVGNENRGAQPRGARVWSFLLWTLRGVALVCIIVVGVLFMQGKLASLGYGIGRAITAGKAAFSNDSLPGLLSIEPPQLYTRERLVNDRFRQANWLEAQLYEASKVTTAAISMQDAIVRRADAALGTGTEDSAADDVSAPRTQVTVSDLQSLNEIDKMRLRLRTDLMDTLLDDGHDLEGNTLYRLNFDAVVMPFTLHRGPPGAAVFIIEARDAFADLDCDATKIKAGCIGKHEHKELERKQVNDDVELLREWQREIQQFLTRVLDARIESFSRQGRLDNPVDPKEDIALDWFLRRELFTAFLDALVYDPDVLAFCAEKKLLDLRGPATGPKRAAYTSTAWSDDCKNWIAGSLGLAWSTEEKSPDLIPGNAMASVIEAGFRKAITRAHYINSVHSIEGQRIVNDMREANMPPDDTTEKTGGADPRIASIGTMVAGCNPVAKACDAQRSADDPAGPPVEIQSMLSDAEFKRAVVRLIAVWREMEVWGRKAFLSAEKQVPTDAGRADARSFEDRLFAVLSKYETLLPVQKDIDALEMRLRRDGRANFVSVRGTPQPRPRLLSKVEWCNGEVKGAATAGMAGPDAMRAILPQIYKCLFLHSEAVYQTKELISHFLLDRLEENLGVYDRENRSIRDFLNLSLDGCGTTGCSIRVSQHRDLPGIELYGARAAGLTPPPENQSLLATLVRGPIGQQLEKLQGIVPRIHPEETLCDGSIKLNEAGLQKARDKVEQILDPVNTGSSDGMIDGCIISPISQPTRDRLENSQACLGLAGRHADHPDSRTEIYLACMLRHWINLRRSSVTVYGVSPRAGDGNDLTYGSAESQANLSAAVPDTPAGSARFGFFGKRSGEQLISNPRIIGLSHVPGNNLNDGTRAPRRIRDAATFGWAIRPRKLLSTGEYQSSHHRLSAVISLPSWWKRVAFTVRACWVSTAPNGTNFIDLCREVASPDAEEGREKGRYQITQTYEIKLPRRVEEVTARFNFDFIRAPYFFREFDAYVRTHPEILSLEAGRPGNLVLQGERLWRGTVVTMNNQTADSILVLPDMKGVTAEFRCVKPPDGMLHYKAFPPDPSKVMQQSDRPEWKAVPLFVWTSEGGTTGKQVKIHPFVQRGPEDRPCWLDRQIGSPRGLSHP